MCDKVMCRNCGLEHVYGWGRCYKCYKYFWRHEKERPESLWMPKRETCLNCGSREVLTAGRCDPCRVYLLRNGKERPLLLAEWYEQKKRLPKWCKVCGTPSLLCRGRCRACDRYWRVRGKERPKRLWCDDLNCSNCKKPLCSVPWKCKGYCNACYQFEKRGQKRPPHLWGAGKEGFCDCGQPANHMIDKFPLCDSCAIEYKKGAWS